MPFNGLRVLALESRNAAEMAQLIRRNGGDPFVAPSMREIPLEDNPEVVAFAGRLFRGDFDLLIFLTGVGTRALRDAIAAGHPADAFPSALRALTTIARGPKPARALREMAVEPTVVVPEPNTWREVAAAAASRPERRIAVQEYGRRNPELLEALAALGAEVTPVRVYRWDLPADTGPLREAVRRLSEGEVDVVLFTSGMQLEHLLRIAAECGLEDRVRHGLHRAVVCSVGPTTSETLYEQDIPPQVIPPHPKMGYLVKEAADRAIHLITKASSSN